MALFPFGLVVGFTITALPFLLTRQGISLDRAASTSAAALVPLLLVRRGLRREREMAAV
jgi:hypothetical protein